MYFVSYHPLKHKLRTNSLSDREALPYLIIEAVLLSLASYSSGDRLSNAYDFLSLCLTVITVIGGTYYVYLQNGGKEGFNLIQKFVVLGWVVSIRFAIVLIPVVTVYIVIWLKLENPSFDLYTVLLGGAIRIIYFQRLGTHIRDTRGPLTID